MSSPKGWNQIAEKEDGISKNSYSEWRKQKSLNKSGKITPDHGGKAHWYKAVIDGSRADWSAYITRKKFNYETEQVEEDDTIWEKNHTNRRELKKMLMTEMRSL